MTQDPNSQIILYSNQDGNVNLEVKLLDETVWLSQKLLSELFNVTIPTINEHIKNIYKVGELQENSTIRKFLTVQKEGSREIKREIDFYNLDMIISVGYRINSIRGTQFRIWATQKLREYLVKGFVMNDDKLANGDSRYFKELLERVRTIRLSEKNFYEQVKDIFATSIDYDSKAESAKEFYSTVQNKFHFAITGYTAAELISKRIDSKKANMGLTSWSGNIITRKDAEIAKNYLAETELKQLKLLVEQFLAFAELQVERQTPMYMLDWKNRLNEFLHLNRMEILTSKGNISHDKMQKVVKTELKKYLRTHSLKSPKNLP